MAHDPDVLRGLLERVQGAGALDPNLDRDLAIRLCGWCRHERTTREGYQDDTGFVCDDCGADSWGNRNDAGQRLHDRAPEVTTSVDAALGLLHHVLPMWGGRVSFGPVSTARLWDLEGSMKITGVDGRTPALAILAALLSALLAQHGASDV